MISTHPLLAPDTTLILLFFYRHGDHRDLHSFLTRRSSDLTSTSAGSSAKTASVFIIARTKDSPTANRSTRATSAPATRSEEHTSELQSHVNLVCRLLLEKKNITTYSLSSLLDSYITRSCQS